MDKYEVVKDELQSIILLSKEIASSDGKITNDENVLLQTLEDYIENLQSELIPMLDYLDDTVSEEDIRQRVRLVAQEVVPKLNKTALQDGIISDDEASIISNILKKIGLS